MLPAGSPPYFRMRLPVVHSCNWATQSVRQSERADAQAHRQKGRPATKWQLVGRSYHQHKLFLCHITLERASYRRASGLQLHRKAIWLKCACRPASMLLVCYSSLLRWCYQILCLAHTPVTFHASEC